MMGKIYKAKKPSAWIGMVALLWALLVMLGFTAFPYLLTESDSNKADHHLAYLFFYSMCVGLVRGVGFIPKNKIARVFLGAEALFISALLALFFFARNLGWV